MISNSRVDPSSRRRGGLSTLLQKNSSSQKKASLRSSSINHDSNGTKKKSKNEKNHSDRKKRTKTKKKQQQHHRHEQLNTNNNATMTDNSLMSFSTDNELILPQVGFPSRMKIDESRVPTKHSHRPKYHVFHRRKVDQNRLQQNSSLNSEKIF